ncbi:MAG: GNAT family N-acetyltransferase [Methanomassiliicoccales archaeon]|nr:MAG: GNAT family N-acetyltransferase [Methanomassiliicoccales archaeon]
MLRLRPIVRADIPSLVVMTRENMSSIVRRSWGIEWTDEPLLEWFADKDVETMVLEEDGDIIGYFSIEVLDSYLFIMSIQLRPDKQGKGYGRTMMREIEASVLEKGTEGVELCVQECNEKALAFYSTLGYRKVCRRGNNFLLRKSAEQIRSETASQKD